MFSSYVSPPARGSCAKRQSSIRGTSTGDTQALLSKRVRPRPPPSNRTTGLMHATLFTGDALRQIVRVYSRVGSVRRGRPRTVPLFLHSEAIFLYASGGSSRDTNAPCSFRRIVCVEIKDRMHTLLLYWTTIAVAISA